MSTILLILIILICVVLSFFVLIQNPKGGGMAGTFGGFGNSVMGAKQSSEGVEKATWYAMGALALVVLLSFVLMPKGADLQSRGNEMGEPLKASTINQPAPMPAAPAPGQQPAAAGQQPAAAGGEQPATVPGQANGAAPTPVPPTDKSGE